MTTRNNTSIAPWQIILVLILSGEIIFGLPFHTLRFFRASFLETFALSNAQLGDTFAVYCVMAMLAYFPGGALADLDGVVAEPAPPNVLGEPILCCLSGKHKVISVYF